MGELEKSSKLYPAFDWVYCLGEKEDDFEDDGNGGGGGGTCSGGESDEVWW